MMLTDSKEFFVDLVSNASMDVFPDNTLSRFKNRLPYSVRLAGDWVVGVQEVFYPLKYRRRKRVAKFCLSYAFYDKSMRAAGKRETIEYSDEERVEDIFARITSKWREMIKVDGIIAEETEGTTELPSFKYKDNRIVIWHGSCPLGLIIPIFLNKDFLSALGFSGDEYNEQYMKAVNGEIFGIEGSQIPQVGTSSHLLFIYTDIIHDHFVGDTSARVLRVIPLTKGNYENVGHIAFTKPYYFPVRMENLENISIILADENGEPVQFTDGRVYISLHFMKRELV